MVRRRPESNPWIAGGAFALFAVVAGFALWYAMYGRGGDTEAPASPASPPGLFSSGPETPFDDVSAADGAWRLVLRAPEEWGAQENAVFVARVKDGIAWAGDGRLERLYPEAAGQPRTVVVVFARDPHMGVLEALRGLDVVLEDAEGRAVDERLVLGRLPRIAEPGEPRGLEHPEVVDLLTLDPDGETVVLTAYEERPADAWRERVDGIDGKLERGVHGVVAGRPEDPPDPRIVLRLRRRPEGPEHLSLSGWRLRLERHGIGFEVVLVGEGSEELIDLD
mgnify:CR=1 FL=1